jgi:hypothetical protein
MVGSGVCRLIVALVGVVAAVSSAPPAWAADVPVGQTLPAKYSERTDILARVPSMAWPLALDDKQRRQIYDAVMAEKSPLPAGADALAPASELSTEQALSGMHPLPESVRDIVGVKGLKYVRAKDKVLLVEPSTRIVVGQIKA